MNENTTRDDTKGNERSAGAPRLCVLLDTAGYFAGVMSDVPLRVYIVDEGAPSDRVYQLTEGIGVHTGVQHVTAALRDDPVGHMNDNTILGSGLEQRHIQAKPAIVPVDVDPPQR